MWTWSMAEIFHRNFDRCDNSVGCPAEHNLKLKEAVNSKAELENLEPFLLTV